MVEGISSEQLLWSAGTGIVFAVLIGLAEWIHTLRLKRIGPLAFGPSAKPAVWARFVPGAKSIAGGLFASGLVLLMMLKPMFEAEVTPEKRRTCRKLEKHYPPGS